MRTHLRWTGILVAGVLVVTAGCSSSSSSSLSVASPSGRTSDAVAVSLNQWSVTPSATPGAGPVTFTVTNDGTITHEFVVLKTDTPADEIEIGTFEGEQDRINEDTAGTNVGETGDMKPGATKTVTLDLQPGHYVFLCNLPGHYMQGMHVDVTVG
jgi:uncharacterized cupredoxin-like copper-binding protein